MSQPDARQILASRLASGEISEQQYDRIRSRIEADRADTPPLSEPPEFLARETGPGPAAALKASSARKPFYLIRLWRGEISLPITYWIWGAIGGSIVGFAFGGLMGAATTIAEAAIFALILAAWAIFIGVSIFRSGGAYTRQFPAKWWGRIAQGMACLGLLASLGNIAHSLPGNEADSDLDQWVNEANRSGPHMVGDKVRFNKVTREGRIFIYNFTIMGPTHIPTSEDIDKSRKEGIDIGCKDNDTRRLLLSSDKLTFRYYNDSGSELMKYDILPSDCR
jgi:hypothetical protein